MKRIYCFVNARGQGGRTDVLVEALCEPTRTIALKATRSNGSTAPWAMLTSRAPTGTTAASSNLRAAGPQPRRLGPVFSGEPPPPSLPISSAL